MKTLDKVKNTKNAEELGLKTHFNPASNEFVDWSKIKEIQMLITYDKNGRTISTKYIEVG